MEQDLLLLYPLLSVEGTVTLCALQTLVLMNDLATVLDMQGCHEEALAQVKNAVALGEETGFPEQHVLLGNMAGILLHQGEVLWCWTLSHDQKITFNESVVFCNSGGMKSRCMFLKRVGDQSSERLQSITNHVLLPGQVSESARLYQEALEMAKTAGDNGAVENIQEGLKELDSKRDGQGGQA